MPPQLMANESQTTSLCENCQLKSKFGNFPFCSTDCASQAYTQASTQSSKPPLALCDECQSKPRVAGHSLCAKTCAANVATRSPKGEQQSTKSSPAKNGGRKKMPGKPALAPPVQSSQPSFGPATLLMPQPMTMSAGQPTGIPAMMAPFLPLATATTTVLKPHQQTPRISQPLRPSTADNIYPGGFMGPSGQMAQSASQGPAFTMMCRIPGCFQPVLGGDEKSSFCSQNHWEEAVASESAIAGVCIMCQGWVATTTFAVKVVETKR